MVPGTQLWNGEAAGNKYYLVKGLLAYQDNLFEAAVSSNDQLKVMVRVFQVEDAKSFESELSKLNLLNEIIEDLGVKDQSFVTRVLDFFQC